MIDGLRLTFLGEDLRRLLADRIDGRQQCASRWRRELARTPEQQTEDEPLLPDHMCEREAERHEWHVEFLEFIRDRVEPVEAYRLGEADLVFAELLPPKPGRSNRTSGKSSTASDSSSSGW
jgi:hypothetical protein